MQRNIFGFTVCGTIIAIMIAVLSQTDKIIKTEVVEKVVDAERPTAPITGTFADFQRSPDFWRSLYGGFEGTPAEFAGQYGDGYRVPNCEPFIPYNQFASLDSRYQQQYYDLRVVNLPADGRKLYLTLILNEQKQDPASMHLINMFSIDDHWLNNLLNNTHYRPIYTSSPEYKEYFNRYVPQNSVPAVLVTEPPDKSTPQGRYNMGRVVFYASGDKLVTSPDKLAYQIAYQVAKYKPAGVYTADGWEWPVDVKMETIECLPGGACYEQCDPCDPTVPHSDPKIELTPVMPVESTEDNTVLLLPLAAAGLFAAYYFLRRRK